MSKAVRDYSLISHKDEIKDATETQIETGLRAVGIAMQRNVGIRAPVDTGRLAASITYATRRHKGQADRSYYDNQKAIEKKNLLKAEDYQKLAEPEKHTVVVGTNVEYAKIKEFDGQEFSHYIRRGIQEHIDDYKRIFAGILSEIE